VGVDEIMFICPSCTYENDESDVVCMGCGYPMMRITKSQPEKFTMNSVRLTPTYIPDRYIMSYEGFECFAIDAGH
jgi:uncharacterized membrane protein YvbJ